jgi:ParB family chromosome partitioning protein
MAKANNPTTSDQAAEAVRVEQVDPASLLVDVNVWTETVADQDFVASVKDLGILQPIRAVRTADGALRVEFGHRRTLAAIEAGLESVPVLVVADERTDDAGAVSGSCGSTPRTSTAPATTDRLGVVEQLSLWASTSPTCWGCRYARILDPASGAVGYGIDLTLWESRVTSLVPVG